MFGSESFATKKAVVGKLGKILTTKPENVQLIYFNWEKLQ